MPRKTLNVHNATVHTATVEVKTLTISGKQVTLAVFRQLQEAPLINDEGYFYGNPWGSVNYHSAACLSRKHLHVVWQLGDELRRSSIRQPATSDDPIHSPIMNIWLDVATLDGWRPDADIYITDQECQYQSFFQWPDCGTFNLRFDGMLFEVRYSITHRNIWRSSSYFEHKRLVENAPEWEVERYKREMLDAKTTLRKVYPRSLEDLTEQLKRIAQNELARRNRHEERWKELCDLPQLFIAV